MLVLGRLEGETIIVGDAITVTITRIDGDMVRVGIQAPAETRIYRAEMLERAISSIRLLFD